MREEEIIAMVLIVIVSIVVTYFVMRILPKETLTYKNSYKSQTKSEAKEYPRKKPTSIEGIKYERSDLLEKILLNGFGAWQITYVSNSFYLHGEKIINDDAINVLKSFITACDNASILSVLVKKNTEAGFEAYWEDSVGSGIIGGGIIIKRLPVNSPKITVEQSLINKAAEEKNVREELIASSESYARKNIVKSDRQELQKLLKRAEKIDSLTRAELKAYDYLYSIAYLTKCSHHNSFGIVDDGNQGVRKRVIANISIEYDGFRKSLTKRKVNVTHFNFSYGLFTGFCLLRNEERTFRFSRVKSAKDADTDEEIYNLLRYLMYKYETSHYREDDIKEAKEIEFKNLVKDKPLYSKIASKYNFHQNAKYPHKFNEPLEFEVIYDCNNGASEVRALVVIYYVDTLTGDFLARVSEENGPSSVMMCLEPRSVKQCIDLDTGEIVKDLKYRLFTLAEWEASQKTKKTKQ